MTRPQVIALVIVAGGGGWLLLRQRAQAASFQAAEAPQQRNVVDQVLGTAGKSIGLVSAGAGVAAKVGGLLGIGGGIATTSPVVATIGIDAAAAAALPGSTAIEAAPISLTAGGSASLGVIATLSLVAIPFALFALAGYFGKPCPQTQDVYDALSRAASACGSQNPGTYGADVQNWLSYKGPGYVLFLNKNFRGMTITELESLLAWHDNYGRVVPDSVKAYQRARWCWLNNPDAQYADANFVHDC